MKEILAPAGNFEKMKAAIHFGCDAVYLAGHLFGMRAAADNFTNEELVDAVRYAHEHGVRLYITVNTMPREYEYLQLEEYLDFLCTTVKPDALIIADIGVLTLVHEKYPEMELHISTQANSVSAAACRAWQRLGAKRVVLARELTLEEIKAIKNNIGEDLELETFIHGSMCISYSGRCLLSNFLTGRDANHGACAQPCRWNYTIRPTFEIIEEKRGQIPIQMVEEKGETFMLASKDLCMIEHVKDLMEAGITSFKIEGRMKSAYYTAVCTNTYRMAMDAYNKGNYEVDHKWLRELESVSHREYATGYFYTDSHEDARTCKNNGYLKEKAFFGTILEYNKETSLAKCSQKNKMKVGDKVELLTPGKCGLPFICLELFDEDMNPIESTPHASMIYYIKLPYEALEGDLLRGANEE